MPKIKSIQELIAMKQAIQDGKKQIKEIYIKSLDTTFKYKEASRADIIAVRKMDDGDADPYLILKHVVEPNLNDKTLQDAFNKGGKPYDIVDAMIKPLEVGMLSSAIIGNGANDVVAEVKN